MKIRNKLQLTFISIALLFLLLGFIEHQYIGKITQSFRFLETLTAPTLTALLESITATRRASIKAVEYSMHGRPRDRDKTHEALQQLEHQIQQYLKLNNQADIQPLNNNLTALKNQFSNAVYEYLSYSEGPDVKQIFTEEENLQTDRRYLIQAVNEAIQLLPKSTGYNLLLIKSEARKVSIKLIEFTLRGISRDKKKAKDALQTLVNSKNSFIREAVDHPQVIQKVSTKVDTYILTARAFLQLISAKQNSVDSIYQKEEKLHRARKNFIKTLYPLIDEQYLQMEQIGKTTATQLDWSARLQLFSILIITFIALLAAYLLASSISTPLNKLAIAARQIGEGDLNVKLNTHSSDEIGELANRFQQMTDNLRRQRKQLTESEEKFSKSFFNHPIAMQIIDLETGRRVEFNDNYCKLTGYSRDELIDTSISEKNLWIDPARRVTALDTIKSQGFIDDYAMDIHQKSGTEKNILLSARILDIGDRNLLVADLVDITEKKLNESLAHRLSKMLEHSVEEIYIFDNENLKFLQLSRGALTNLGYNMQEMAELTPINIKPDFNVEQFKQFIQPLYSGTKDQLIFETRHQRKDGSTYPVEVRLQYTYEDNSPVFLAIIDDLTERKKIEAELESHRLHLEKLVEERTSTIKMQANIIDQTNDSVITVDLDGNITSWNGGAERLFKIPANSVIGQNIMLVYPENSEQFLQYEIVEPVKAKGMHETEVILKRGDNSEFPAHLSLSMLYSEDGSPTGTVGYTIDLTEQKKREQKLQLLTRQLQDSNKELEAFSYSVSHDLRSPLRSIDGFSLAIVEDYGDQLDDTAKDYLSRVRKAAQRMGLLIDELLELSRVNQVDLNLQQLDLTKIAQHSFDELKSIDPDRKIELLMDDKMQLFGDARLFSIAMDNLLGNAWKFTAQQENARITLKSVADKPDVFYIKDNGAGFDMRHADKLFGVFQRLHQVSEFPGTGVGLATVQRIIHRHRGHIWAESEPGKGATFFFTLNSNTI